MSRWRIRKPKVYKSEKVGHLEVTYVISWMGSGWKGALRVVKLKSAGLRNMVHQLLNLCICHKV